MRVLLVCQRDLTAPSEKQALGFASQLARTGHTVLLSLRGERGDLAGEGAVQEGVRLSWRRYLGPRLARATLEEARAFEPELIHAFNPRYAVMQPSLQFARATGAPVLVHWEDDEWSIRKGPGGRSIYRRVGRLGRRVLCRIYPPQGVFVTERMLDWSRRHARGFDALTPALAQRVEEVLGRPCAVVLPVMPEADWAGERLADRPASIPADRPMILFTGELHPGSYGDVMLALRALAIVHSRGHRAVFAHAGSILPRYDLAQMAADAGLGAGSAVALGYLPFGELPGLLRSADILVQPGRPIDYNRLRLPSKMQAYLASGTPTISFSVGFAELLEDRVEVLKTFGESPEELADRIMEVLDDAQLRATLSRGGAAAAARLFDPVANTAALEAHYRACLARA